MCVWAARPPISPAKSSAYSDKQNGDDKITCLASEEAHRAALEFLTARLA